MGFVRILNILARFEPFFGPFCGDLLTSTVKSVQIDQ